MKHLLVALKLAASVALFWFVFSKTDVTELASHLNPAQIAAALGAGVAVVSLQAFLVGHRLRLCARMLGEQMSPYSGWVAAQYAGFFSHTPISFVGGDAMRVWHMVKQGMPLPEAAKAVVLDRAVGFFGLMALVLASVPALHGAITDERMWIGFVLIASGGTAAALLFVLLGALRPMPGRSPLLRWASEFATLSRYFKADGRTCAKSLGVGLAVTALSVLAVWGIGTGYGAPLGLGVAFAAAPVVFLIAMIPVSVAGWGLREGAFVVALGLFGVSPAVALTVSITFGFAVLLAYSPAPVLWFLERKRPAFAGKPAGS